MLTVRVFIYVLVFLKLTEANTTFYPTGCETFDVKSDVEFEENSNGYNEYYGRGYRQPTRAARVPKTLYSYAECRYVTLNPGHKLHFDNTNLKYILFQHSDIPLIPVGVFSAFEDLTQLYLNDSNVKTLHPGAFNGLANLEELYLQNNNITELTRGTLNSLSNLRILNISNNMLTSIEENALLGLFNLNRIDLSNNNLKNLSSTVFNGLSSVTFLDLSHNYISEISSNLFVNLSKHDTSSYSHNNFVPFPTHSIEASDLHLDLSYNHLITIDFSYFPASQRNLYLANNRINSLENLHYLPGLEILDLSKNQITDIKVIPFSIHYFNASGNRITNLSNTLFHNLSSLATVDFSFNFITNLHEDIFQGLKHLEYLYLQNNKLTKLPLGCFRDLNLLLLLNISSNRITTFEFGTFSGMSNLRTLDISNNTLTDLFENTFYSLPLLETLNIGDNFLTTFDSHDLLKHVKHLRTLSLNNNPWHCKSLLNIITNFESNADGVDVLNGPPLNITNIHGIACSNPYFNNTKELNNHFETPRSNETFEKSSANSKQLEMLRNFFNGEFLNSSFYKFFQNYNHSFEINSSRDFLKYLDYDFKNTTFYRYFDQDISNATFFKSFNETLFKYSAAVRGMYDETLNASLHKISNSDSLSRGFSKYFEDGYKNSSFYKYFTKEFANSGFFQFFNGEKQTVLNSTLMDIASELRSIRNFFTKEFKNSTFYRLLEEDHINRKFNLSRLGDFVPEEFPIANSNSTPAFAKLIDNFGQQGNQDILAKISDLQNGITILMIIVIIILICMMLLFALRNFSVPLKHSINRPVSLNASNKSESTSGLELM